ncbi:E3 ubiquitin-protein ligase ATL6-like [Punica granatum]|uniref:RING-type E3 ubiquitin transferase n=2 Tax=Punica granatum TaxID=22663 RepID=A0A218VRX4_PUNGR|nr:E3 ubiquitin-protein ligase ATL6-like [Punica granatum]XP_031407035.1 E3 ubiquitin-protein ligase ATL6-like [Punica granatum]OWM62948.1 hypothetical protein CDL15_Pgr020242 [Punica granatum]PKI45195.1 hypothetical protein CRG98_034416 [Punica granatum]
MKSSGGPRSSLDAASHGSAFVLLVLAASIPISAAQPAGPDAPNLNYARFSPSMVVIVIVLVAALFFMAFFSIYIRRCSDSNAASVAARPSATGRSRRAQRGLDQSVINTFPTLEYSKVKGLKIGKGALECAVCLCEFEDDEMLRLIPKCDHVFHPDCIDAWLGSHTTCPVCRANLVPQPDDSIPPIPQLDGEPAVPEPEENREVDLEQGERPQEEVPQVSLEPPAPEIKNLNRSRTRGSRSNRIRRLFPRSHSTGHSLVQPGEDTERFTLRLPAEVRKQIVNRQLNRAMSMVVLPREGSSRRGYRTGEGSSRGRFSKRFDMLSRSVRRSSRWTFNRVPSFFSKSGSLRSPRVAADSGEGTSSRPAEVVLSGEAARPPV